jgi:hypothetical protein
MALPRPRFWKLGEHDHRGGILAVEFEEIERVEDRISIPVSAVERIEHGDPCLATFRRQSVVPIIGDELC